MSESQRGEPLLGPPPEHIGAVFETGRYGPYVDVWNRRAALVRECNVADPKSRTLWALDNMRAFADGTLPNAINQWKPVIDHHLSDLKLAAKSVGFEYVRGKDGKPKLGPDKKPIVVPIKIEGKISDTEKEMKAMMAISSSARAMEQSGGSASKYVGLLTQNENGNLDVQDSWEDFLLHEDPGKLTLVLTNPMIRSYYVRLLEDAGYEVPDKLKNLDADVEIDYEKDVESIKIDFTNKKKIEKIIEGGKEDERLIDYLRKKKKKNDGSGFKYKGGLNAYIAEVLLENDTDNEGVDDSIRWSAARLACDAFLVDKFTEWEYIIDSNSPKDSKLQLMPWNGWGGNPLRSTLQPSFLPDEIKNVYSDEDDEIMELANEAFRPSIVFGKPGETTPLTEHAVPPSMVGSLKTYARYNEALWRFLGSSRASGIPGWSDKIVNEEITAMEELMDQVYGGVKWKNTKENPHPELPDKFPIGKHITGLIMARILDAKAVALTAESLKPTWKDDLIEIFTDAKEKPFRKVMEALWGPDLSMRTGILTAMAAQRTRLVFKDNIYGAEDYLSETWELLYTNDQSADRMDRARRISTIRFILGTANVFSKIYTKH